MPRPPFDDDEEERLWSDQDDEFLDDEDDEDEDDEDFSEDETLEDDEDLAEGSTGLGDLPSMLEEGLNLAESGDLDEAIEILTDAVERFPESPLSHYNLGVAHFMKLKEDLEHVEMWEDYADDEGHYEEAVASFEHALEIDEKFVGALNNLATLYALRDRAEDAIDLWERSLEIDPDQPEVREDLDEYRQQLEEPDEE
jgi:tetratricopeptide (TPR) repeat protein